MLVVGLVDVYWGNDLAFDPWQHSFISGDGILGSACGPPLFPLLFGGLFTYI